MAYWVFKGDTEQLNKESESIVWDVCQSYYANDMKKGDSVFIWSFGAIVALCEITDSPFIKREGMKVPLKIEENRIQQKRKWLMLYHLEQVYGLKNSEIFKMKELTNYLLTEEEYQLLHKYWKDPEVIKWKIRNPQLDKFLFHFKENLNCAFTDLEYVRESYQFFKGFSRRENIETLEWQQIKRIGDHLSPFKVILLKKRAFDCPRAPISHYRDSFIHLLFGDEPLEERVNKFRNDKAYKLYGFGPNTISELVARLFPDHFCFFSHKEMAALELILKLPVKHRKGEEFGEKLWSYQSSVNNSSLYQKYLEIVGKQTDLPIFYEISEFLRHVYDAFSMEYKKNVREKERQETTQYWLMDAPRDAQKLQHYLEKGYVSIETNELGDLTVYKNKKQMVEELKKKSKLCKYPYMEALVNYQFYKEIKKGDYIFLKYDEQTIIAVGKITSCYKYRNNVKFSHSIRNVKWFSTGKWKMIGKLFILKPLLNLTPYEDAVSYLLDQIAYDINDDFNEHDAEEEKEQWIELKAFDPLKQQKVIDIPQYKYYSRRFRSKE